MDITEDYVSFETAKLLKEKGFDELCSTRPTQFLVIKWLRIIHNIEVEARPVIYAGDKKASYYSPYINASIIDYKTRFEKSEEATEKAILYALKDLIK